MALIGSARNGNQDLALINDNNLEEIVKYLQSLEKESKKSKPGTVKIPKLKKVSGSDSYKITPLGRQYLTLIEA